MANINFDDGRVKFNINGDENRFLMINPADVGLLDRLEASVKNLTKELNELEKQSIKQTSTGDAASLDANDIEIIRKLNQKLRASFDEILGDGASDVVFQNMNPLALSGGKTIYEKFMESFAKAIEPYFKKETSAAMKNIGKYKDAYDRLPAGNADNKR